MKVVSDIPTGYKAKGRVTVYRDGLPFYVRKSKKNEVFKFNLPRGNFVIDGLVKQLENPVKYRPKKLPRKDVNREIPKNITVTYGDNPNKCSVHLPTGKIFMDNSFKKFSSFVRTYILFHEIGHYSYASEELCDRFAANQMLKRGFNPSQIAIASKTTLESMPRKKACYDYVNDIKVDNEE